MSPWTLWYFEHEAATANAAFLGLALALVCHFEASIDALSAEWLNLLAGLWLLVAPFVVGFTSEPVAMVNSLIVGALVAGLAASAMSLDERITEWWHNRAAGP